MGTLSGSDVACQGAVVHGVILGEPADDGDGNLRWDDPRIPDGDVEPVPVVVVKGAPVADSKHTPTKDHVVTAERADRPVAIRVKEQLADVKPVDVEAVEVKADP